MISEQNRLTKKREVTPMLMAIIEKLIKMQKHCAKLEYYDNDAASKCLKLELVELRDNEMKQFHKYILSIREEINEKYNQSKKQKQDEQSTEL